MDSYRNSLGDIRSVTRGWNCYYPEIRLLIHPASVRLTWIFCFLRVTPNTVTVIGGIFSGVCLWLFINESYFQALLCYVFRLILDYTDGALARYSGQTSKHGALLDRIVDYLFYVSLWITMGVALDSLVGAFVLVAAASSYILVVDYVVYPRLHLLKRRAAIKQYFLDRGLIIGFAPFGVFELWGLLFFVFSLPLNFFNILSALVIFDLGQRVYESLRYATK
jgi:phosphatidylglycerophosphate synthase